MLGELDLLEGVRNEVPRWVGCGRECPLPTGRELCPFLKFKKRFFELKLASSGVFWELIFAVELPVLHA